MNVTEEEKNLNANVGIRDMWHDESAERKVNIRLKQCSNSYLKEKASLVISSESAGLLWDPDSMLAGTFRNKHRLRRRPFHNIRRL